MITYPIIETFTSLKGEGAWTGHPMFFIRFGGCPVRCNFCDTSSVVTEHLTIGELLGRAQLSQMSRIVITGGEPLCQPELFELILELNRRGFTLHLETSGQGSVHDSLDVIKHFDWICVSPKTNQVDLDLVHGADEVKFLVGSDGWEGLINFCSPYLRKGDQRHLVMPLARPVGFSSSLDRSPKELIPDNIKLAVQYCLDHPSFGLTLQIHKYLSIK